MVALKELLACVEFVAVKLVLLVAGDDQLGYVTAQLLYLLPS